MVHGSVCDSVEFIQLQCGGKTGTFSAIDIIQKLRVDVIIGPGCGSGKQRLSALLR